VGDGAFANPFSPGTVRLVAQTLRSIFNAVVQDRLLAKASHELGPLTLDLGSGQRSSTTVLWMTALLMRLGRCRRSLRQRETDAGNPYVGLTACSFTIQTEWRRSSCPRRPIRSSTIDRN
jgi:hypothetical protein